MIKTLTKHGNSLALILDKLILELLDIEPDTALSITTDGKSLNITPVRAVINNKYARTFKKLAN